MRDKRHLAVAAIALVLSTTALACASGTPNGESSGDSSDESTRTELPVPFDCPLTADEMTAIVGTSVKLLEENGRPAVIADPRQRQCDLGVPGDLNAYQKFDGAYPHVLISMLPDYYFERISANPSDSFRGHAIERKPEWGPDAFYGISPGGEGQNIFVAWFSIDGVAFNVGFSAPGIARATALDQFMRIVAGVRNTRAQL